MRHSAKPRKKIPDEFFINLVRMTPVEGFERFSLREMSLIYPAFNGSSAFMRDFGIYRLREEVQS